MENWKVSTSILREIEWNKVIFRPRLLVKIVTLHEKGWIKVESVVKNVMTNAGIIGKKTPKHSRILYEIVFSTQRKTKETPKAVKAIENHI